VSRWGTNRFGDNSNRIPQHWLSNKNTIFKIT
ncbi:MAG: hypothetical protein ACI8ZV_000376, partial [Chitinophagales bacterium]